MKVVALLPMKGNSVRVPNKNLKNFNKNPLYFLITLYYWFRNYNNFDPNYPWIREGKFMIPERYWTFFKFRIYPLLKTLRNGCFKTVV